MSTVRVGQPGPGRRLHWFQGGWRRKWLALTCIASLGAHSLQAAPPRFDHVVIVMEENRTPGQIIGDLVNAPYLTSLANGGVRIGSMFALLHPSQPNYLHLFSGSNQGVIDDGLPPNFSPVPTGAYPFRAVNLGASLIAAGFTFAGFSEQLEAATTNDWADFDPHSATHPGIYYRRKHNPWANWVAKTTPIPANQLSSSVNRAFTQFPTNFSELPTVCFVIPNQLHDMHDGSRRMADDWLRENLGAYAVWAKTNNSLLIVTWDEDDYNESNQIPTIFYGAGLHDGTIVTGAWTLHNLLRTIEEMYGIRTHAGAAAQLRPIVGAFTNDPPVRTLMLRQGLSGYTATQDTLLSAENPTNNSGASPDLVADLDTSSTLAGAQEAQVLIRFDSIFGSSVNQLPANAVIHSAKLLLYTPKNSTTNDFDSNDTFRCHRMIMPWNDNATWNGLGNGVSADNVEAAATASFSVVPVVDGGPAILDVTADLELFKAGTPNRGWLIRASSSGTGDGWTFRSSEATPDVTLRPTLEIVYSVPAITFAAWASAHGLTSPDNAPDADPDGDGVNNLTEFAYNLNPLVADAAQMTLSGTNGLPAARYLPGVPGGTLEVIWVRRKASTVAGLTYTLQFGGDLVTWSSPQSPPAVNLNAEWERVIVRDIVSGVDGRFARILLTLEP
ncbi:MAG TPA: alkaline phosphatase family protein [Verrucomicrobiae bacterium]|nr:alkaline phosphatase family protein [Verrucomicrobiae bacterium]